MGSMILGTQCGGSFLKGIMVSKECRNPSVWHDAIRRTGSTNERNGDFFPFCFPVIIFLHKNCKDVQKSNALTTCDVLVIVCRLRASPLIQYVLWTKILPAIFPISPSEYCA